MYFTVVLGKRNLEQYYTYLLIIGYSIPILLACLLKKKIISKTFFFSPLIGDSYGEKSSYCWISNDSDIKTFLWSFMTFYVELWICIGLCLFSIIRVIRFLKKCNIEAEELKSLYWLIYFPIILICCWTFATIHRIYNYLSSENNEVLTLLSVIFIAS